MTITNNVAAKFAVAIVAVAMMFSAFASTASAQNVEDMSLEELLALVAALQAQTGSTPVASSACPYTWTRTLNMGSTGADVMQLQKFLNSMPETQVAPVGSAGSAGMETSYYGPATGAAVANFQMKYRAEILSPLGLVNATTFFGASTMAQANKLCTTGTTPGGDDDDDDTTGELSGEASLETYEVEDGEQDEVEEGEENASVAVLTTEFTDGDAEITRIDFSVTNSDTSIDPWDVFDEFTIWVDDEEVGSIEAADRDDYIDEDDGTLRISDLDIVAEEDEELEITIAASVQNGVDSDDRAGTWTLTVDAMRWFDADDVATTEKEAEDEAEFSVEEGGFEEELNFTESSENPDATTIVVDADTARTRGVEVLAYEIEAEGGDITLYTLEATVSYEAASTTSSMDSIFDNVYLEIDGEKFDAEEDMSTTTGATGSQELTFDIDGDIEIDEDDSVEVKLFVDLKGSDEGANFPNGTQIMAEVDADNVDATEAEGADDLESTPDDQLKGTAQGEDHTLVAEGIVVPADSFESDTSTIDEGRVGIFEITVDVMAVEDTFYLDTDDMDDWFTVDGGAASTTVVVDSSADDDTDGIYRISEDSTETFTFTVTVDPAAAGSFRVVLDEVEYSTDETGAAAATTYTLTPASDYRTGYQALTN